MRKTLIRWRFLLHLLSPPFAPPRTVIFCRFLRAGGKQKIPISLGNQDFTAFCFSSKWCHQESNRGHKDFQSFALPTELWHLLCPSNVFRLGLQRYAYISNIQIFFNDYPHYCPKISAGRESPDGVAAPWPCQIERSGPQTCDGRL